MLQQSIAKDAVGGGTGGSNAVTHVIGGDPSADAKASASLIHHRQQRGSFVFQAV